MKKKIVFQNLQKLFTLSFFQAVDGSVSNSIHFMHAKHSNVLYCILRSMSKLAFRSDPHFF